MMNIRVVFNLWLAAMLGLLVVWKSAMRSDAKTSLHKDNNKMQKPPNFTEYEAHFPAIIPDLSVFLKVQRRKQDLVGVDGITGNSRRNSMKNRSGKTLTIASDGSYVLDMLNNWGKSIKAWSGNTDEINVVLEPGQAWTQELVTYKTTRTGLTISLPCGVNGEGQDLTLSIKKDPFCGLANQVNPNPVIRRLITALPCRFFRLSKWVFSQNIGVLVMVYVQVHKGKKNRVARLFLMHIPKEEIIRQHNGYLSKGVFALWVYQNSTNLVPLSQVDIKELAFNMKSLANISKNAKSRTSKKSACMLHGPSIEHAHSHNVPSYQYYDSYNQPSIEGSFEYHLPYWSEEERAKICDAAEILVRMKDHN